MKTKPNEYDYFQTLNLKIYIPDKERNKSKNKDIKGFFHIIKS